MRYEKLEEYSKEEIAYLLASSDEKTIKLIPLSVGEYCDDFSYAQELCAQILKSTYCDEIRANAVLGLSYLARRFGRLDNIMIPLIKKEITSNLENPDIVAYSVDDIKHYIGWDL